MAELGDRVECKITGFTGIIIAKTSYLQGCDRISVKAEELHEGKPIPSQMFDDMEVDVIEAGVVERMLYMQPVVTESREAPRPGGPREAPDRV